MDIPSLLIVDDSKAQRFIMRRCLEGQRVEIVGKAANGMEAVAKYAELRPDIVLLDLVMPEMDGQTALEHILSLDPSARVVITSSMGSEDTVRECLALGALSFLQKPLSTDVLLRAISEATAGAVGAACIR